VFTFDKNYVTSSSANTSVSSTFSQSGCGTYTVTTTP
jgi:hypothetical protein